MLTKLPESGAAVPVILTATGERAVAFRCEDLDGFHISLPRYGKDGGEGGCVGGKCGDWIVSRADGCVVAVKASGAVAVSAVETDQ